MISSIGFGGGVSRLFNGKNSEVSVNANVYLDNLETNLSKRITRFCRFYGGMNGNL